MKMVTEKSWKEFQDTGLLFYINQILHVFGWAICLDVNDEGDVTRAFPSRVKFRGFGAESIDRGYTRVTKYMKENVDELLKECEEE